MHALVLSLVLSAAPPLVRFEATTLPNGLEVLLVRDGRLPTVSVDLWYRVGAASEQPGTSGFAHLFEHLMFQGSKHRAGNEQDLIGLLEAAGASDVNAATWNDRTQYYETLPANRLELALWVESERMAFLLDGLDQTKLDTQRDVVRNERRQSFEDVPYGKAELRMTELLFPRPHPYAGAVIGSHDDLARATLDDVKAFFRTYYVPNGATLVLSGDFEPAAARALVEKYFGPIPRGAPVPAPQVETRPLAGEKRDTLTDDVQLARVMLGFIGPPAWSDEAFAFDLVQEILSGGKTSRLYEALVYRRQVAQDVDVTTERSTFGSAVTVRATARPGHFPAELEALLDAEIARLQAMPPTAAELQRAQRNVEARLYRALERSNGPGSRADLLAAFSLWRRDPGFVNQLVERWRAVGPEDVRASARRWLPRDARVVVTVNPSPARAASAR